jgi:hypothetical protein
MKFLSLISLFTPPIFKKLYQSYLPVKSIKNHFEYENNFFNRIAFINRGISNFNINSCKYLEIGVCTNEVFNSIPLSLKNKIGVDPVMGGTHRMTSDDFFKNNSQKFDIIFIDGLHTYEQCQKDCLNSLNALKENGIIFFHDMLPRNYMEENVPPKQKTWSGDVWKVAVEINNSSNMEFKIANIDRGIGILKPKNGFEYKKNSNLSLMRFEDFVEKFYKELPIVNSDEAFEFINN